MNSFSDCCSFIFNKLPKAELPFVPALICGTLFSIMILLYLYKKYHQSSTLHAFKLMLTDIFVSTPVLHHAEFMKCNNANCIRCQQSEAMKEYVIKEWKMSGLSEEMKYRRVDEAIGKMIIPSLMYVKPDSEKCGKNINLNQKPSIFYMSLPANPVWTDLDVYRIEQDIIKLNFKIIKEEFDNLFQLFQNGNTHGWKKNDIPSGHWCTFPLIDQGLINTVNVSKCPNLATLFGSIPALMKDCVFGNVCFSILYPDSHIEPHYGPTNIRLRCHFGLYASNDCWLEVDGQQLRWKEEEAIIFDDSFLHSAYFASSKHYIAPRVVLIMDFWHPSITPVEKAILLKLFKPGNI